MGKSIYNRNRYIKQSQWSNAKYGQRNSSDTNTISFTEDWYYPLIVNRVLSYIGGLIIVDLCNIYLEVYNDHIHFTNDYTQPHFRPIAIKYCMIISIQHFQWHFGHGYPVGGKSNYRYIMNQYAIAYNAVFIGITSHSTINQNNILGTTANGIDIRTTEIHIGLSTYPETGDNMTNWDEFDISIGY